MFIYQPTIEVPDAFYKRFNIPKKLVFMSDCFPDFIEVVLDNGKINLLVVDAKASTHVKFSHKVQVAIYAMYLEALLKEKEIDIGVSSIGGVWLR